jgi:hypothetical protein
MPNPFDQFDQPSQAPAMSGPVTVGTPRPDKPELRQVGNSLGLVDKNTGHFTPTYTPPKDETAKDPNGTQGMAAGFYGRALFANKKYGDGLPPRDALSQGILDALPTSISNSLSGHDRQLANTYARDFVAATLRKESGAAISEQEYQNQYVRYFPQPGDSPDTIKAKAQLRETAIQSLRDQAGPAASSADENVQKMLQGDASGSDREFGNHDSHGELTPEQQARDQQFIASNPTPEQYAAFLEGMLGKKVDHALAAERLKLTLAGGAYNPGVVDPRVQQRVDQMQQEGGGGGAAFVAGAADAAGLGLSDEFGAGVSALGQSLSGQGSFGDNYNVDLQANRQYQRGLQNDNPLPYLGGQFVGGAALPVGRATSLADLAKAGVAYGGAYGVGSGEGLSGRLTGGVTGAAAGGAIGAATGGLSQLLRGKQAAAVPDLVDPVSGRLNEPLEAMSPGGRVASANDLGINLPMGAATDRGGAIIEKGLDNLPGSAGVMNDARRTVEGQVSDAAENVASKFGSSRTLNEAGSELQRGAIERNDRADALITKAYNRIPIADTAPASNSNTVGTLQQLTGRFESNPELAGMVKDPRLEGYMNAIQKGGLSWKDMKDFRTLIGEKIGELRVGEDSRTSDLRSLYGALSEDMRATASAQGNGALKAFERANSLNRENEQLVQGALTRILGKDGNLAPEKAAAAVQAMTKGGKATGDIRTLAQIKGATVKSGAWDEVAGTLIRLGGQPANSPGRSFDPGTFVRWYADMSEPARRLLFKPELRQTLNQFVAVNQRLAGSNALRNTSNTVPGFIGTGFAGGAGMAAASGNLKMLLAIGAEAAANYGMAKVWTNPGFVKWATGFAKANSQGAARAQIGRLAKLATTNPELREGLMAIQRKLLESANDNFTPRAVASAPDQGQQDENRP